MGKRRSKAEEDEIVVEILKVQGLALQRFAEDFEFGYIDARELRRRLSQQVRAILEVAELLDSEENANQVESRQAPPDSTRRKVA